MKADQPIVALFDCDGVVLDTESQYTGLWSALGEEFHTGIPDFGYVIKGQTLTHILDTYFPGEEDRKILFDRLYAFEREMSYDYIPGAHELLKDLKNRGIKNVMVTSSDQGKMSNVYRAHPEFTTLFDRILTSEDFTASKPDPFCYLLGAKVFNAPLENCMVFEDSFNGIQSGKSAGIFTVGLATTNPADSIRPLCDYVIPDFSDFTSENLIKLLS